MSAGKRASCPARTEAFMHVHGKEGALLSEPPPAVLECLPSRRHSCMLDCHASRWTVAGLKIASAGCAFMPSVTVGILSCMTESLPRNLGVRLTADTSVRAIHHAFMHEG